MFTAAMLVIVVLVSVYLAEAQQPTVPLIGYLSSNNATSESTHSEGIRLALRELGYIEGQNITVEYRYSEAKVDRARARAVELVGFKVDIIVVSGGHSFVRAAKNATKTITIVMTGGGGDPVQAGQIESLARSCGNVTGLTNLQRELGGKRLKLLKEAVPKLIQVAVLYDPAAATTVREVKELLPVAARALKLTVRSWEVGDADDFDRVFAEQAAPGRTLRFWGPANGP